MAIYHVTANQTMRNNVIQNIHHYSTTSPLSGQQIQEMCDELRAAYVELDDGARMSDDWSINNALVRRVDVPDLPSQVVTFTSGPYSGSGVGTNTAINQAALLVSFYAPTEKPRRGRTYIGGFTSNQIGDNGFVVAGMLANMASFGAALLTLTVSGDTAVKVAARYTGTPPRVTEFNAYDSFTPRSNPAVQRRRRLSSGI